MYFIPDFDETAGFYAGAEAVIIILCSLKDIMSLILVAIFSGMIIGVIFVTAYSLGKLLGPIVQDLEVSIPGIFRQIFPFLPQRQSIRRGI